MAPVNISDKALVFQLRPRLLALSVAACFSITPAWALPTGAQVAAGAAKFNQAGNSLVVTNTPGAIINWQSFSIGALESVRFQQQSSLSSVLNRVTGSASSAIHGALRSNGRVFLVNPNGILFGPNSKVDVNGLIASSLDISNEDFRKGRLNFLADAQAGSVKNAGTLDAAQNIYLVGPDIENSGIIRSAQGEVLLAAGRQVTLVDGAHPDIQVVVSAPADQAVNLGDIVAGKISVFGSLVQQRGRMNADRAEVDEHGRIVFRASGDTLLDGGSVSARNSQGEGGRIEVLGNRVAVTGNATLDASGAKGGGTILVGGDYQGKNPAIPNAQITYFGPDATLKANAEKVGAGGTAIVWADDTTRAYGTIEAKGNGKGAGGLVETSGKRSLDVNGIRVNTGGGTWLLDPADFTIAAAYGSGITGATLSSNLAYGDVTILSSSGEVANGNGDIFVNDAVAWSSAYGLTLSADRNIGFNAGGSVSASNGGVALYAYGGSITQASTAPITAVSLHAESYGGISLMANNVVGSFSATSSTDDIFFKNTKSGVLNLGGISAYGDVGIWHTDGDIYGGDVISASTLAIKADAGSVFLEHGDNNFDEITASVYGGISVFSNNRLSVGDGTAMSHADFSGLIGINAGGLVKLKTDSWLDIYEGISTPGIVVLEAGDDIVQYTGSIINATGLSAKVATGNGIIDLTETNNFGVFAAFAYGGDVLFKSTKTITPADLSSYGGVVGITANGVVELETSYGGAAFTQTTAPIIASGGLALIGSASSAQTVSLMNSSNSFSMLTMDMPKATTVEVMQGMVDGMAVDGLYLPEATKVKIVNANTAGTLSISETITTASTAELELSSGSGGIHIGKTLTAKDFELASDGPIIFDNTYGGLTASGMVHLSNRDSTSFTVSAVSCSGGACIDVVDLARIEAPQGIAFGSEDNHPTSALNINAAIDAASFYGGTSPGFIALITAPSGQIHINANITARSTDGYFAVYGGSVSMYGGSVINAPKFAGVISGGTLNFGGVDTAISSFTTPDEVPETWAGVSSSGALTLNHATGYGFTNGGGKISAPNLTMTGGFLGAAGTPLATQTPTLSFTTYYGGAYITNNQATPGSVGVSGSASGGTITFTNFGATTVTANTTAYGALSLTANSPLAVAYGASVSSTNGSVYLTAASGGALTLDGTVSAANGSVTASAGSLTGYGSVITSSGTTPANSFTFTNNTVASGGGGTVAPPPPPPVVPPPVVPPPPPPPPVAPPPTAPLADQLACLISGTCGTGGGGSGGSGGGTTSPTVQTIVQKIETTEQLFTSATLSGLTDSGRVNLSLSGGSGAPIGGTSSGAGTTPAGGTGAGGGTSAPAPGGAPASGPAGSAPADEKKDDSDKPASTDTAGTPPPGAPNAQSVKYCN
ncbi:hypothetical protein MASR1M60_02470 [Rhodocyclaceae bacterium]